MNILIRSHEGALALAQARPGHYDLVFITSPLLPYPVAGCAGIHQLARTALQLEFDDLDGPVHGMVEPRRAHVAAVLDWARGKGNYLVACRAGISRSSATAVVLRASQGSVIDALTVLTPGVHWPNPLVVRYGEEILGKPGLADAVGEWKYFRGPGLR